MSANLELMCAYAPDEEDEADDDLPLFEFGAIKKLTATAAGLWKRVLAGATDRGNAVPA